MENNQFVTKDKNPLFVVQRIKDNIDKLHDNLENKNVMDATVLKSLESDCNIVNSTLKKGKDFLSKIGDLSMSIIDKFTMTPAIIEKRNTALKSTDKDLNIIEARSKF